MAETCNVNHVECLNQDYANSARCQKEHDTSTVILKPRALIVAEAIKLCRVVADVKVEVVRTVVH